MSRRSSGIEKHRFKAEAASTADEARRHRELSAKGGIASGEARRKRISIRDELEALLSVDGGTVAKSIVVSICREAKSGNVGAFKAIASVLGELQPDATAVAINAPMSPIELVLPTQDEIDAIKARREARNAADERKA